MQVVSHQTRFVPLTIYSFQLFYDLLQILILFLSVHSIDGMISMLYPYFYVQHIEASNDRYNRPAMIRELVSEFVNE